MIDQDKNRPHDSRLMMLRHETLCLLFPIDLCQFFLFPESARRRTKCIT